MKVEKSVEKYLLHFVSFLSIELGMTKSLSDALSFFSQLLLVYLKQFPLNIYSCILILVSEKCMCSYLYQLFISLVQVFMQMEVKPQVFWKHNPNILSEKYVWKSSVFEFLHLYCLFTILTSHSTLLHFLFINLQDDCLCRIMTKACFCHSLRKSWVPCMPHTMLTKGTS